MTAREPAPVPRAADEQVPVTVTAVEIIDGRKVPIGEPRQRTISRGALDLLHGTDPTAERLKWANAVFNAWEDPVAGLADAIEAARTVKLNEHLVDVFAAGVSGKTIHDFDGAEAKAGLRAVFEALGLKVIES